MGIDNKYGRVTTEFGDIPDDEPVVVFRGRDRLLVAVLDFYARQCAYHGSPDEHVDLVFDARKRIEQWQTDHADRLRTPTSEAYFRRQAGLEDGTDDGLGEGPTVDNKGAGKGVGNGATAADVP